MTLSYWTVEVSKERKRCYEKHSYLALIQVREGCSYTSSEYFKSATVTNKVDSLLGEWKDSFC